MDFSIIFETVIWQKGTFQRTKKEGAGRGFRDNVHLNGVDEKAAVCRGGGYQAVQLTWIVEVDSESEVELSRFLSLVLLLASDLL